MSSDFGLSLPDWDWGGRVAFIGALAQSIDEFQGIITQSQILITDPDIPDKRVAGHKVVDYACDAAENFLGEPSNVQAIVAAMPANATKEEALGVLRNYVAWDKVKASVAWLIDHFDEFAKYVLPWILMIFEKVPKSLPFTLLLPRLRAA